jgi:hypothetical protein
MKKSTRNGLIAGGTVVTILGIIFWPRDAKADEPDDDDEKNDDDGRVLYRASDTTCFRDGQPFNAAQLGTPEQAVAALNVLGTPMGTVELMQSDAKARTPIWEASRGYAKKASIRLKTFQAVARSLNLDGHVDAPVSAVDGVWGECTARSVSDALKKKQAGLWPYPPVAGQAAFKP